MNEAAGRGEDSVSVVGASPTGVGLGRVLETSVPPWDSKRIGSFFCLVLVSRAANLPGLLMELSLRSRRLFSCCLCRASNCSWRRHW